MTESHPAYHTNGTIPGISFDVLEDEDRERMEKMRRHCIALVQLFDAELGYEQTYPRRVR